MSAKDDHESDFERLLKNYHGGDGINLMPTEETLLANYYGLPRRHRKRHHARPAPVVSLSIDDGEVLAAPSGAGRAVEYVVERAPAREPNSPPQPQPADGYVTAHAVDAEVSPNPSQEYGFDLQHVGERVVPDARWDPPQMPHEEAYSTTSRQVRPGDITEDDIAADMEAILSGQKLYDPLSKKLTDRDEAPAFTPPPPERPIPNAANEQAIFDRIAQSMEYANAYDLGTVELQNRFSEFDRLADIRERAQETIDAAKATGAERAAPVGKAEFIEDLDAMREQQVIAMAMSALPTDYTSAIADWSLHSDRDGSCKPSVGTLSTPDEDNQYSRPFYDAGEHAMGGNDQYVDMLRVGPNPGVRFSYGQIIAMPDLYESVDQMMAASAGELTKIKALIDRNASYYTGNKKNSSLDVTNKEWDTATNDRYLKLAEDNYDHFSPNVIFTDAIAKSATKQGNNKMAWEAHHRRAIKEAQKMWLDPANANRSFLPEWPLIINAFGDHFLTDAFASGHLINKELMIAYFKANFFSGGSLNSAGNDFFGRVAKKAFVADVRKKFSVLETANYPVCVKGWCFMWHPNIDTENMFRKLLLEAAAKEPVKVANVAVRALHDVLNRDGIEVTNRAGDGTWSLFGDGYLLDSAGRSPTLKIMQKAVQQSIDNLSDPATRASNLNFSPFFEKVWRYVPQPTPASQATLERMVKEYTNPKSTILSDAAAEVIRSQVDSLIKVLLKEGKLKKA